MKVEELKEKARRHELKEEWQKAFDLYRSAVRAQDEDEAPDITLFNRVGDIQTRLGQINGAVEHYEKAIDLYLEAELPNNAIAICKKVLRNLPDRNQFFLRMGQIRASQGFLTDARQNFLTYAERQTARGDIESALNALIEFVDLSPEDVEIRTSLASQLEAHGRAGEAVEQYTEIYRLLVLTDRGEEATGVSEKLAELAPDVILPDPESILAEEVHQEVEDLVVESTSLGGLGMDSWLGPEDAPLDGVEVDLGEAEADPGPPTEGVLAPDLGIDQLDGGEYEGGERESSSEEGERPAEEAEELLPAFEFGSEAAAEEAEVLSGYTAGGEEALEGSSGEEPLPFIGFDDEEEEEGDEEAESLPLLGLSEVKDGTGIDDSFSLDDEELPLLPMDDEVEEEPEAADTDEERPWEASLEDASFEVAQEGLRTPFGDHREAADRGDLDLALERVRTRIAAEPDSVELHQRLVEYAFRKNDQEVLISAYMALAGCLAGTGSPLKAKAVYQQVLSLSPGHEAALAGIQDLEGGSRTRPSAQVASSEEYVDLGSMILGDGTEETTRWKVAAEAPSGDEEADFAKMLSQFKEKVSEHVAADDVVAHHDLGTAYMEMGLFNEAIGEFQAALRASPKHLPTHEVMGRCWLLMGNADMAVRALNRALAVPCEVEDELIGIYYLMGRAQEERGNNAEALEFYEKVFSLDINFEDVTERLRALR